MNTTNSASPSTNAEATTRCQHLSPSGRRCRHARKDSRSRFCPAHDFLEQQRHDGDRADAILGEPDPGHFDTAAGINRALTGLYVLLAEDKISPRRAAVLAYISSLQLRTLPAIEHEVERDAPVPRVVFDLPEPSTASTPPPKYAPPKHEASVIQSEAVIPSKVVIPSEVEGPWRDRSMTQLTETNLAPHPTPPTRRPDAKSVIPSEVEGPWRDRSMTQLTETNFAPHPTPPTRRPSSTPIPAPSGAPTASPPSRPISTLRPRFSGAGSRNRGTLA